MNLGPWISRLLDIEFCPDQDFGSTSAADAPERGSPAKPAKCEGILYGPFVHGAICKKEDLASCKDCFKLQRRYRWLCPMCRDDREIVGTDFKKCFMGYCPARETQKNPTWGMGWKKDPWWKQSGRYDPSTRTEQQRIADFKFYHPDPQAIMSRLRGSIPYAGVGRDMQARTPGVAYGENREFAANWPTLS